MSGVTPDTARDYISRTIATVRNHRDADNCWPQWANVFADEIERLRDENERLLSELATARQALRTAQHWHEQLDYDEALNVIDEALRER